MHWRRTWVYLRTIVTCKKGRRALRQVVVGCALLRTYLGWLIGRDGSDTGGDASQADEGGSDDVSNLVPVPPF